MTENSCLHWFKISPKIM